MWFALFSQSGSEIVSVARHLGRWPDYIFTDNKDKKTWHRDLQKHSAVSIIKHKDMKKEIESNISMFQGLRGTTPIVTLHGYLRILPPGFCDKTRIYNGHPGLITKYPELKGFNPQKKAFEAGTYKTVGSVIHEVIPELDSGDVIDEGEIKNDFVNLEDCTLALHDLSIQLWTKFLKVKL